MGTRGLALVLALTVGVVGFSNLVAPAAAFAKDKDGEKGGKKHPVVRKALQRTTKLLAVAHKLVKGNKGTGKAELRKAMVLQVAARKALSKGNAAQAAFLTLKARKHARAVIAENKGTEPAELADTAEETGAAAGATDADAAPVVAEAEKETPAADALATGELPPPPAEETAAE